MRIIILFSFITLSFLSLIAQYNKDKSWLIDSIPINYSEGDKLEINKSLTIHNSFRGDYSNVWSNYQNTTIIEAGVFIKDLPIFLNIGAEKGNLYTEDYFKPIINLKIDFNQYLNNLKNKFQYTHSIESIESTIKDNNLKEKITKRYNQELDKIEKERLVKSLLEKEISNLIGKEIDKKLNKSEIDSIYNQIKFIENYEKMISDPQFIKGYTTNKKILKEYNLGNKTPNINYDSIFDINNDFEAKSSQYRKMVSEPSFSIFREKWNNVLNNKDKTYEIANSVKNKYEKNRTSFLSKFSLKKLNFRKFNLGQTSVNRDDLVFRGFMVNGFNIEMTSPMYINLLYSLPFQTNFISNFQLYNLQNKEVSIIGGSLGNNPDKKLHYNIGIYKFDEDIYDREDSTMIINSDVSNTVVSSLLQYNFSKSISTRVEFANSQSDRYNVSLLQTSYNFMGNSGLKLGFYFDIPKTKSRIELGLQDVGTNYYSSANPFIRKGRGGRIKLNQKIGEKIKLKSIDEYRSYNDTNGLNSILSTNNSLTYKFNENNSIIVRASYFNSHLEFNDLYSDIINQLYGITWATRIKILGLKHSIYSTIQYLDVNSKGSRELNNLDHKRDMITTINYTTMMGKINLNIYGNYCSSIDSIITRLNNGGKISYSLSNKTRVGMGYSLRFENNNLNSSSITSTFTTQLLDRILLSGSIGYLNNSLLQINRFNPLLRLSYNVF